MIHMPIPLIPLVIIHKRHGLRDRQCLHLLLLPRPLCMTYQLGTLLVFADLTKSHSPRTVPVGLLDTTSRGGTLTRSLYFDTTSLPYHYETPNVHHHVYEVLVRMGIDKRQLSGQKVA